MGIPYSRGTSRGGLLHSHGSNRSGFSTPFVHSSVSDLNINDLTCVGFYGLCRLSNRALA